MDRMFSREIGTTLNSATDKVKIGIWGISPGAGATFFTLCFSKFLAESKQHETAVVEVGGNNIFCAMGLDKHFASKEYFKCYTSASEGQSLRGKGNFDEGINWVVRHEDEGAIDLDPGQELRLINNALGEYIICDLSGEPFKGNGCHKAGGETERMRYRIAEDMDFIFCLIDPLPSKMIGSFSRFQSILQIQENIPTIFIVNKMNKGVNLKELRDFLKIKSYFTIPMVNADALYSAEYNCKSPYSQREIKNQINETLEKIYQLLGKNVMNI